MSDEQVSAFMRRYQEKRARMEDLEEEMKKDLTKRLKEFTQKHKDDFKREMLPGIRGEDLGGGVHQYQEKVQGDVPKFGTWNAGGELITGFEERPWEREDDE